MSRYEDIICVLPMMLTKNALLDPHPIYFERPDQLPSQRQPSIAVPMASLPDQTTQIIDSCSDGTAHFASLPSMLWGWGCTKFYMPNNLSMIVC